MTTLGEIKQKIEAALPGATAEISDPRNDGTHLKAIVTYAGFKDLMLVEQHRMVLKAVDAELQSDAIHALSVETKVN